MIVVVNLNGELNGHFQIDVSSTVMLHYIYMMGAEVRLYIDGYIFTGRLDNYEDHYDIGQPTSVDLYYTSYTTE